MPEEDQGFQSYSEEPEEYTGLMIDCPHCKRPVHSDALFCLYCGESLSSAKKGKNRILAFIVAAAIVAVIIIFLLQSL